MLEILGRGSTNRVWKQPILEKWILVNKVERSSRSEERFDIRHRDVEFGACPASFLSPFGPIFSLYVPFSPF